MPLYEFECRSCSELSGTESAKEILVRSTGETPICPDCGGDQLIRLMSATAAPAIGGRSSSGQSLPVSGGAMAGEACGAPRCCGGGCQI